ncbi:hypothetical protein LCGC14_1962070 [marine sediment metagenome]|uniref:Uncharacterized protein n=1 Tax=marine sediment metagenome TaxID=412755 RepID=A0A0F9G2L3_9ZZZZ
MKLQERLGTKKRYNGEFKLYRTDNLFNYVEGKVEGFHKFGKIRPIARLDCDGVCVGEGLFAISNGDFFKEN